MATVTIEYYGFSGSGKNVTEAKRDAGRKIEAMANGTWSPEVIQLGENAMLVYRDQYGWHDMWLMLKGNLRKEPFCGSCNDDTRQEAVTRAVFRLACEDPDMTEDHPIWERIPYHNNARQRKIDDWKRDRAFQTAYKAAPEDCEDKHRWACEHSHQFAI